MPLTRGSLARRPASCSLTRRWPNSSAVITTLFRWAAALSLPFLHALGGWLGWLVYWSSPSYRRRLHANVAQARLDRSVARAAVAEAGRMLAELPLLWSRPIDRPLGALVRWEGTELVEQALAAGRGLVILTPHLGSFEVIGQVGHLVGMAFGHGFRGEEEVVRHLHTLLRLNTRTSAIRLGLRGSVRRLWRTL